EEVEVLARIRTHLKISELLLSMRQQNQQLAEEITRRQAAESQLKAFNQALEGRIKVETAALNEATDNLQQAKAQVVQRDKLSALGELIAGVAHEINNPIGCITNNVSFAAEYGEQLLAHITHYQRLLGTYAASQPDADRLLSADFAAGIKNIQKHANDIDLAYIAKDFPALMASIKTSGDRITAISQSLRTFARADTHQQQPYQLRQGLDGTLLILRHRLKALGKRPEILTLTEYGDLPAIHCYPGQINQVFMNIIANAIDAIEEGYLASTETALTAPEIKIETVVAGDQVGIKITDNAGGMPEAVRSRIFESQFTTKKAGKGTGLGLSIAHKIVTETHGGTLECTSTVGTGTTFRILLPIGTTEA
ncbi:MAG: ATP-binding protein, partial [Cyanobacteria bacterium J06598_3]